MMSKVITPEMEGAALQYFENIHSAAGNTPTGAFTYGKALCMRVRELKQDLYADMERCTVAAGKYQTAENALLNAQREIDTLCIQLSKAQERIESLQAERTALVNANKKFKTESLRVRAETVDQPFDIGEEYFHE